MINVFQRWESQIGGMKVGQTVHFHNDGKELLIISSLHGPHGDYHNTTSVIPFADHEKLADEGFRLELARRDLIERVRVMRTTVEFAEKALAAQP